LVSPFVLAVAFATAVTGCGTVGLHQPDCAAPYVPPAESKLPPVRAAIRYLRRTQYGHDNLQVPQIHYAGDWPQCFTVDGSGLLVREASPFMATFIHHALSSVSGSCAAALGLDEAAMDDLRVMRVAAIAFMLRFQAGPERPDAGTFGFWPRLEPHWRLGDLILGQLVRDVLWGPVLAGDRAPANMTFFPSDFAIVADADDTATVYAALLDHERLDGGSPVTKSFERFFADWRDLGQVPVRNRGDWLPAASGAFLTWLDYGGDSVPPLPNDVDAVVNANVLYAIGRHGRLSTLGAAEAIETINAAVRSGAYRTYADQVSLYYPDNLALHYCVSRAFREGGVTALQEAIDLLVADLLASVVRMDDGGCYWSHGQSHLSTAFAVLTLVNAGYDGPEVAGAIRYLESEQNPETGGWDPEVFFRGRGDSGVEAVWISPALTTAMALEALARART
jgi:hypothetical protein